LVAHAGEARKRHRKRRKKRRVRPIVLKHNLKRSDLFIYESSFIVNQLSISNEVFLA
jgi:hypothetical protein